MKPLEKQRVYLKDYQSSSFLIDEIQLQFELDKKATRVTNIMQIRRQSTTQKNEPLRLNGEKIHLEKIYLNTQELSTAPNKSKRPVHDESFYELTDDELKIFNLPDAFELRIISTCNPLGNTALEGLYISNDIFCTQCEPHGFRKITYYIDRPDVMAKFITTIIADLKHYPILLSNGNCISEELLSNGKKKVVWQDPFKKPCYLFALVAGKLYCHEDFFITQSGRKINLRIFVELGNESKTQHAMEMLKLAMRWDEEKYGREYDLDIFMIVAVADFNMGAMENKGLNIFNAKYILANQETATDTDYEGIATVVAHEYFHNWTGNRITCRDWFQLSLKEGLTVFRDQEFTADLTSKTVVRIDDARAITTAQFAEDVGPLAHPVRPASYIEMNNFYTVTVYQKGAEVVRMLHSLEKEAGYRKGMDLYFERYDGMAVTCDDFVKAHADANNRDYSQFMRWYDEAGTPQLTFSDHFDFTSQKYTLTVTQNTLPLHIPIRAALFSKELSKKPIEQILELKEAKQTFEFFDFQEKPIPSLMRNFSAPVRWAYPYSLAEQIFLLQNDNDDFNRFEMGQQIFYRFFMDPCDDKLPQDFTLYLDALKNILCEDHIEMSLKSRLLTPPSYRELIERQNPIQVQTTIQKREWMIHGIAKHLLKSAHELFLKLNKIKGIYRFDAKGVGERNLKQTCLRILLEAKYPEAVELTTNLFHHADNMTDRFNAIYLLMQYGAPSIRKKVLEDFYNHYYQDNLVMEKWFALQAGVPSEETLEDVKALMQHSLFELKNPNKVRALLGTFVQQNFVGFHSRDGKSYEFLANQILSLDQINPVIAARLIEPLTQWARFEDSHAVLMRSSLQYIYSNKLSNNLYEIVEKSLNK